MFGNLKRGRESEDTGSRKGKKVKARGDEVKVFFGNAEHGFDRPAFYNNVNRQLGEVRVLLTYSSDGDEMIDLDDVLPPELVELKAFFQAGLFSQNPGVKIAFVDPTISEVESVNGRKVEPKWFLNIAREFLNLDIGGRLDRTKISWTDPAAAAPEPGPSQNALAPPAPAPPQPPARESTPRPSFAATVQAPPPSTLPAKSSREMRVLGKANKEQTKLLDKKNKKGGKKANGNGEPSYQGPYFSVDLNPKGRGRPAQPPAPKTPEPAAPQQSPQFAQILQQLDHWAVHGATMSQYIDILTKLSSCNLHAGTEKYIYMIHFKLKESVKQVKVIPGFTPENGMPEGIKAEVAKFKRFNEVTVFLPQAHHVESLLEWLDGLFGQWDLTGSPYWFRQVKFDKDTETWVPKGADEPRLRLDLGPGNMFSEYDEQQQYPEHEPWMRKPGTNAEDANYDVEDDIENADYASHPMMIAHDDIKQMEFYTTLQIGYDMQFAQRRWDAHCNLEVQHEVLITNAVEPGYWRFDFRFNRKEVTADIPKFAAGQMVKFTCASYEYDTSAPVFRGTVVPTFVTNSDFVAMVRGVKSLKYPFAHKQTRKFYLTAEANYSTFHRRFESLKELLQSNNETTTGLVLNQGYEPSHHAQRPVLDHDGQPVEGQWTPIQPIRRQPLTEAQADQLEGYELNTCKPDPEQREFIDAALTGVTGYTMLQGPAGTGKSSTTARMANETLLRELRVMIGASSNEAVAAVAEKMVEAWIHLPGDINNKKNFVVLETLSTLQKNLGQTPDNPIVHSHEMMGLLDSYSNDQQNKDYYKLGAHMRRLHLILMNEGSQKDKESMDSFDNVIDLMRRGKRINEEARSNFNAACNLLISKILKNAVLVVGTCAAVSTPIYKPHLGHFDLLVQDEAANSCLGDTIMLMTIPHGQMAAVGDDKQLAPTLISSGKHEYYAPLGASLFERQALVGFKVHRLRTQYRMHPQISRFPSMVVYPHGIRDHSTTRQDRPVEKSFQDFMQNDPFGRQVMNALQDRTDRKDKWEEGIKMRRLAINVPYAFAQGKDGSRSLWSLALINSVVRFIYAVLDYVPSYPSIARIEPENLVVLSFYKLEVTTIRWFLSYFNDPRKQAVQVYTVDAYQGKERDVVFLSVPSAFRGFGGDIGFVKEIKRLNVALTRAKQRLFIFGNFDYWRKSITDLKRNAHMFALLSEDLFMKANTVNARLLDVQYSDEQKSLIPDEGRPEQAPYWLSMGQYDRPTYMANFIIKTAKNPRSNTNEARSKVHILLQAELKKLAEDLKGKMIEIDGPRIKAEAGEAANDLLSDDDDDDPEEVFTDAEENAADITKITSKVSKI